MLSPLQKLTNREWELIDGLDDHARVHAQCLLVANPELRPTSGRRSAERNRAVGGVEGSYHLQGRACDFGGSRQAIRRGVGYAHAQRVSPSCSGPEEVLDEGDHLHVAW
jgi:hypothetical protein